MAICTLSARGVETAKAGLRASYGDILSSPYDRGTNPGGYINLGVAENFIMLQDVAEFVNSNIYTTANTFTYGGQPWGSPRLRAAMAKHMNKSYFNPVIPIQIDDLVFANGITSLCEMLGFVVGEPGDGILMPSPIYQAFHADFGLKAQIKCVYTPFEGIDQASLACVHKYEAALLKSNESGTRIRALLIPHPHNPLGKCYPEETIIGLMKLCQKYRIHLLMDEIYAHSVYDIDDPAALAFKSCLSFDSSSYIDPDLLHVLYGMSKDFAAGGLRLGCIYTRNKDLVNGLSAINQFHWATPVSDHLATLILEDEEWMSGFLARSKSALAAHNKLCRSLLDEQGIEYAKGANAGFALWINLKPWLKTTGEPDGWTAEKILVQRMLDNKVLINSGASLFAEEPGWFRIIFSQEEHVIREGLQRVFESIGQRAEF